MPIGFHERRVGSVIARMPGVAEVKTTTFSAAVVEQTLALSSAIAILKGRLVESMHFVEKPEGGARLVIELGSRT